MRRRAIVLLLFSGGLLAGCASDHDRSSSQAPRRVAGFGIAARLPAGWDGRVWKPKVDYPIDPILLAANFRLPPEDDENAGKALAEMTPTRVRVVVSEVGNVPGSEGFRVIEPPLSASAAHVVRSYPGIPRSHVVATQRFALQGRSFFLLVDFGTRPRPGRLLRQVNALLGTLRVRPHVRPGTWRALRRPLALSQLPPGRPCPRTRSGRETPQTAFGLGTGPAYAVIGGRAAVLAGDIRRNGWVAHKTLWAVSPRYRGPLLIRARRLDRPGTVTFGFARHPSTELHIPPRSGWGYRPSTTLLPGPGCYGFRVDGRGLRRTIVFVAR